MKKLYAEVTNLDGTQNCGRADLVEVVSRNSTVHKTFAVDDFLGEEKSRLIVWEDRIAALFVEVVEADDEEVT